MICQCLLIFQRQLPQHDSSAACIYEGSCFNRCVHNTEPCCTSLHLGQGSVLCKRAGTIMPPTVSACIPAHSVTHTHAGCWLLVIFSAWHALPGHPALGMDGKQGSQKMKWGMALQGHRPWCVQLRGPHIICYPVCPAGAAQICRSKDSFPEPYFVSDQNEC